MKGVALESLYLGNATEVMLFKSIDNLPLSTKGANSLAATVSLLSSTSSLFLW